MKSFIGLLGLWAVVAGLMACSLTLLFSPISDATLADAFGWLVVTVVGGLALVGGLE